MASKPPRPPAPPTEAAPTPTQRAGIQPAKGTPARDQNTTGRVENKTETAPKGAATNPPRPWYQQIWDGVMKSALQEVNEDLGEAPDPAQQPEGPWELLGYGLRESLADGGGGRGGGRMGMRRPGGIRPAPVPKPPAPPPTANAPAPKAPAPAPAPKPASETGSGGAYNNGDLNRCRTGTYKDLKCKGGHKHHVVPDRTYRTDTRKQGEKGLGRVPNTDSLNDGFSVCLSEEDHKKIHQKTDPKIVAKGKGTANGMPDGVATLGDVLDIALEDLKELYRDNGNQACADDVDKKANEHFKNQNKNTPVNTTKNPKRDLDAKVKNGLKRKTGLKR